MADAQWPPPLNVLARNQNGRIVLNTFSWLYVPLIAHALGGGQYFPYLPVMRVPTLRQIVLLLATAYAAAGISFQDVFGANLYIDAARQEIMLNTVPMAAYLAVQYGNLTANASIAAGDIPK